MASSLSDGTIHELARGDRMLERLDLAYAVNVHVAQGVTSANGIVVMDSRERNLNSIKSFLVALTRIADRATLVVDDGGKMERAVSRNPDDKTSALEVAGKNATPVLPANNAPIRLPDPHPLETDAIGRYARAFAAVETAALQREWPEREDTRAMHAGADTLDRLRAGGAGDLRTVLDRMPALAGEIAAGKLDAAWRAWVDEGRARLNSGPDYIDRFVADWRTASGERAAATNETATMRAERKMERLVERMENEPALERALEKRIPERQIEIDRSGIGSARNMDMG